MERWKLVGADITTKPTSKTYFNSSIRISVANFVPPTYMSNFHQRNTFAGTDRYWGSHLIKQSVVKQLKNPYE